MENYIDSQQHWEDSINADYDERERRYNEQKREIEQEQEDDRQQYDMEDQKIKRELVNFCKSINTTHLLQHPHLQITEEDINSYLYSTGLYKCTAFETEEGTTLPASPTTKCVHCGIEQKEHEF
jgi:hypothetical protein